MVHPAARGFTLLAVLATLFILSLSTQRVVSVLAQQAQREREAELLRVGHAIRTAIGTYYQSSPGSIKRYPASLEELTDDRRFVGLRRHLRRVYADPLTGQADWVLLRAPDGGIAGVHSRSTEVPLRQAGTPAAGARSYQEWRFEYTPPQTPPPQNPPTLTPPPAGRPA